MTPEAVNMWFTPFHYFVYLGTLFVAMVVYYQWRWARACKNYIQVLVVQQGGGGNFELAPKVGGSVSLKNPATNTTRTWAINELATIDVLYPGVGFVPSFLQKTIRMVIVHEGDWEPLLNRSPHQRRVASPDLVAEFLKLAEASTDKATKESIEAILDKVSTAPTREMIASPAVLGNLIQERITEIVATVGKDIFDPLKDIIRKLGKPINPTIVYIGLGLSVLLLAYLIFKVVPALEDISVIKQALGVL